MSKVDMAQLSQNKPTSADGFQSLLKFYNDGTNDLKDLLSFECDVIFECRYCRSLFRSIINFVSHKRLYCKGSHGAIAANADILWQKFLEEQPKEDSHKPMLEDKEKEKKEKFPKNLVKLIDKKTQNVEIPVPGTSEKLVVSTMPIRERRLAPGTKIVGLAAEMAGDSALPYGKIPVVIPADPNVRMKSSKLRSRRDNILSNYSADLPANELQVLHKIFRFNPSLIDGTSLKCMHPNCGDVRPFKNFLHFGYHVGIKHTVPNEEGRIDCCYCCNHPIKIPATYLRHYYKCHHHLKEEHKAYRIQTLGEGVQKKSRTRSMSPERELRVEVEENVGDEEEAEDSDDQNANDPPPLITPIDLNEISFGVQDEDDNEAPPTLTRMGRNRIRTRRLSPSGDTLSVPAAKSKASPRGTVSRRNISRSATPASDSFDVQEALEMLERRLQKDVKYVVGKLVDKVEKKLEATEETEQKKELMKIRLFGRKKKLRGKPALMERQRQLEKKKLKEAAAAAAAAAEAAASILTHDNATPSPPAAELQSSDTSSTPPKEEESTPEVTPQPTAEEAQIKKTRKRKSPTVEPAETSEPGVRPSRAKKRPDWMESYHLESLKDDKEKGAKVPRNEDSPTLPTKADTPAPSPKKMPIPPVHIRNPSVVSTTSTTESFLDDGSTDLDSSRDMEAEEFVLPSEQGTSAEGVVDEAKNTVPSPGSARRKQDMTVAMDKSKEGHLKIKFTKKPFIPEDITAVPVLLSSIEKEAFFSGLVPADSKYKYSPTSDDNLSCGYVCRYCHEFLANLKDGRRHIVSHIRARRLTCKLCGSGGFFASDMRTHLQDSYCPALNKAPFPLQPGPKGVMTRKEADSLIEIFDQNQPGKIHLFSGKIISANKFAPHTPDPAIEEIILGILREKQRKAQLVQGGGHRRKHKKAQA